MPAISRCRQSGAGRNSLKPVHSPILRNQKALAADGQCAEPLFIALLQGHPPTIDQNCIRRPSPRLYQLPSGFRGPKSPIRQSQPILSAARPTRSSRSGQPMLTSRRGVHSGDRRFTSPSAGQCAYPMLWPSKLEAVKRNWSNNS